MTSRTPPTYELLYHPQIPGRGEYIRLAFEATGTPYTDVSNASPSGPSAVEAIYSPTSSSSARSDNPPVFSPPALRVAGAGKHGGTLLIHQTPSILFYLGPRIGLAPADDVDRLHADQLVLTALDLSNEAHDTHHPVAVGAYYEEQKDEALRKAVDFREKRLPKFLGHFERVLKWNADNGDGGLGRFLVGAALSYADTTLWQVIDGLFFAFPKEMAARAAEFPLVFTKFYPALKDDGKVKAYLASERRLPYSMGLYRHYPELDRQQ